MYPGFYVVVYGQAGAGKTKIANAIRNLDLQYSLGIDCPLEYNAYIDKIHEVRNFHQKLLIGELYFKGDWKCLIEWPGEKVPESVMAVADVAIKCTQFNYDTFFATVAKNRKGKAGVILEYSFDNDGTLIPGKVKYRSQEYV